MSYRYVVYHQVKTGIDCPDGLAAAWVATCTEKYRNAVLVGAVYQEPIDIEAGPGDDILCVDFVPPDQVIKDWSAAGATVTIIDHHKGVIDKWDSSRFSDAVVAVLDKTECGATLAWKTLRPDRKMPAFLEFVKKRDLWLDCNLFSEPIPETLIVHEAMALERMHRKGNIHRLIAYYDALSLYDRQELLEVLGEQGRSLVEKKREIVRQIGDRYKMIDFPLPFEKGSLLVPFLRLSSDEDRHLSDIGNYLVLRVNPPFVVIESSDGRWQLRSQDQGLDVEEIASSYGGGGHRNASGFNPAKHPEMSILQQRLSR